MPEVTRTTKQTPRNEETTMADTSSLFRKFNDRIKLTESKKEELRISRDAIRNDIKDWLLANGEGVASFRIQGSFAMNTTVNPIGNDDYDIDFGLHLNKYKDTEMLTWPEPKTVHNWVISAVTGRTSGDPINKDACVRVSYGHGYHVDIPIYIEYEGMAYLASLSKGWIPSDASGFVDWFKDKKDDDGQLVRIVRYLKRWKDYRHVPLKGIELTILSANNFSGATNRDDDAVRYTVENISASLQANFKCVKPVAAFEDLFQDASESKINGILDEFSFLAEKLQDANDDLSQRAAANYLREVFGDDFPKESPSANASSFAVTSIPSVLKHDGRSG